MPSIFICRCDHIEGAHCGQDRPGLLQARRPRPRRQQERRRLLRTPHGALELPLVVGSK